MLDKDIIIQRYKNLEKQRDIAKDYNVTPSAIGWIIYRYLDRRTIKAIRRKKSKMTAKKYFNI